MLMLTRRRSIFAAISLACLSTCCLVSPAQTNSSTPQLQAYTAPDKSASAGLPSGWQVTTGAQTVIVMTGPNNETIDLGNTIIVRNATFQLGQKAANGIDLSIPNSDTLAQKFTTVLQNNAALSGQPAPQINLSSATPLQVPATIGQCGRIVASVNGAKGLMTVVALMCSLPIDSGGTYKLIFKLAQAPPAIAQQESALAAAVFASYRMPAAMLQRKIAPFNVPPAVANAQVSSILASTAAAQRASDTQANCFDLTVLRETPTRLLPRACGGPGPN
jgi:hypothetical protein